MRPGEKYPREQVDPRASFSAQELEKATGFRNGQFLLFAGQTAIELIVLVIAVRRAPRAGRRPVLTGALTAAALVGVTTVVALPLRAVARERAKHVGLVTQSWGGWGVDVVKGTAISAVLAAGGGAVLVLAIGRFGRRWWVPGAAAITGFAVVMTFLGPIVLDPVFNKFTPLPDGSTRTDVLELARRAGVDVGQVFEVDASRRTTAANAYVNGIGHTKRVVLYDTLLRDFTPAETRLVVAHELAHVRHRDVPRFLLYLALVAPPVAYAVSQLVGPSPSLPALLAGSVAVTAPIGLVGNGMSRAIERRCDAEAVAATGDAEAFVAFHRNIALKNLADPDPPRWQQIGTHPTTVERIALALAATGRSPEGS